MAALAAPAKTIPVPRARQAPVAPPPPMPATAAPATATAASPRVLAAQKALSSLGYGPVRLDGVPGVATRQAIARFEADRKLPVTGELSARVVKEIAAVSGMPVN
jgi:peptidoglycan hydrolase-like protein with peptidoglycan-binding domain